MLNTASTHIQAFSTGKGPSIAPDHRSSSHEDLCGPQGSSPGQAGPPWPSAMLNELYWPFQQLLLETTHTHTCTPSWACRLDQGEVLLLLSLSPSSRQIWAASGRVQLPQLRPSGQATGRGRCKRPGLLYTALSNCHTDASQKHTSLWTQPPNHHQLQGIWNITCSALSNMWPVRGSKSREVSDGFLTGG